MQLLFSVVVYWILHNVDELLGANLRREIDRSLDEEHYATFVDQFFNFLAHLKHDLRRWYHRGQTALRLGISEEVKAAYEFALNKQLRIAREPRDLFEDFTQVRIVHDVIRSVAHFRVVEDLNCLALVAVKRFLLRAFDEDYNDTTRQCCVDALNGICSDALGRNHSHEVVLLDQLEHNLSSTNELSIDVKLRE